MDLGTETRRTRPTWAWSPGFLLYGIPALIAVTLSLPCFTFTYQWDDYDFLTNALLNRMGDLLPDPADPFYRPISRGVYFLTLSMVGDQGALLGHTLNALFLGGVVFMLARLTSRLAGPMAGLLAGLTFAGIGAVPTLVGWVCCDQDLLSMLSILVALDLRMSGRGGLALAAAAAALLSKETALAVIPVLVLFDWILARRPFRIGRCVATYGLLVAVWSVIHPAVRTLVSRGLRGGATGYVGLEHPELWPKYLGKYLLIMSNTRITLPLPAWPVPMIGLLLLAVALAILAVVKLHRGREGAPADQLPPAPRALLFALGLSLGPLVLTSVMIRSWAPYYAAFPALGAAILVGIALSRTGLPWQVAFIAVFFALGVWSRESSLDPRIASERNFRVTSPALRAVEGNFKKLLVQFPPATQVLLSVQARGNAGVYTHMYTFGALRVWYSDPTIRTHRPEDRVRSGAPEFLFVIAPDLDVIMIDTSSLAVRTASGRDPDYAYVEGAVRAYCTGLFGTDETDQAAGILLHMPEVSSRLQSVHWRIAATYLISDGRTAEADSILRHALPLERGLALANLRAVLAEQPRGRLIDDAALQAFGIASGDVEAMQDLMRWYARMRYAEPAIRFAGRVLRLDPGNEEAVQVEARMRHVLEERKKIPPAPGQLEPTLG